MRKRWAIVVLLLTAALTALILVSGGEGHGDWLYDEDNRWWYQVVDFEAETVELREARNTRDTHREQLHALPGCNKIGLRQRPDGNWAIILGFQSRHGRDEMMRLNRIPSLLDGVPVVVDEATGKIVLL